MPITGTDNSETLTGTAGNDVVQALGGDDVVQLEQGGDDLADGGSGDDRFVFGATFTAADGVDGGVGVDRVELEGNYSAGLTFSANTIRNVERLVLMPGFSYSIATVDANVAAGVPLFLDAAGLGVGQNVIFNGAAETDAPFSITTGAGNDTVTGGGGGDTIVTGTGNDVVNPGGGANEVFTQDGDDLVTIVGGATAATTPFNRILVGSGFDYVVLDYGSLAEPIWMAAPAHFFLDAWRIDLRIFSGAFATSQKILQADADGMTLTTGSGDDILRTFSNADIISSGAGDDVISARGSGGSWRISGQARIDAGAGKDVVEIDWSDLGAGQDVVLDTGNPTGVTLGSGATERYLRGVEVFEDFRTGAGNDQLTLNPGGGFVSRQQIQTNAGDDLVIVHMGADVADSGSFSIDMGDGAADRLVVDFSGISGNAMRSGPRAFEIDGTFVLVASDYEYNTVIGGSGDDSFREISVNIVDDLLQGGAGDDLLGVEYGEDVAEGGTGSDTLEVGYGHFFPPSPGGLTLIVSATPSATGLGGYDGFFQAGPDSVSFSSIENFAINTDFGNDTIVTADGNDVVRSGSGADVIDTGAGDDFIDGGSSDDSMTGGTGNDVYVVDDAGDTIVENAGEGIDEIRTGFAAYSLAGLEIENLTGLGTDDQALDGNAFANRIDGGAGADTMTGLGGNDTYLVDNAGDHVVESVGGGTDLVLTTISYALGDQLEGISARDVGSTNAMNLYGNGLGNEIRGNAGANILLGGAGNDLLFGSGGNDNLNGGIGADTLIGGTGDDTYILDGPPDSIIETAGAGRDTIFTSSSSYNLNDVVQVELLSPVDRAGTSAVNFGGNSLANIIYGNAGANVLQGNGGNDVLLGLAGDDIVNGGANVDVMTGGIGNDIYYVDSIDDQIVENAGEGTNDRVFTSVTYTLREIGDVEQLVAADRASTSVLNLTGNSRANILQGSEGANILNGGGGNDTLLGFGGADTFVFSAPLSGTGNVDNIVGFTVTDDNILLDGRSGAPFASLAPGTLSASAFTIGANATTAVHRIIYDAATGNLYFDADGSGAGARVQFAHLSAGLALTNNNFVVADPLAYAASQPQSGAAPFAASRIFASAPDGTFAEDGGTPADLPMLRQLMMDALGPGHDSLVVFA